MFTVIPISAEEWDTRKPAIHDLYISQKLPLAQVVSHMTSRGFKASKQQYARQFTKWGFSKNSKDEEWRYISQSIATRARYGQSPREGFLAPRPP